MTAQEKVDLFKLHKAEYVAPKRPVLIEVKKARKRFFVPEKSAIAPRMGAVIATVSMAIPTARPHMRVPSAPPTTEPLK